GEPRREVGDLRRGSGGAGHSVPGGADSRRRPAVRADAAVDDVRDLDVEAQRVVRDQAGGLPHGAGDVLEPTALAADQVVVVVVAVDLVLHAAPAHGDPAYELDVGQRIEDRKST